VRASQICSALTLFVLTLTCVGSSDGADPSLVVQWNQAVFLKNRRTPGFLSGGPQSLDQWSADRTSAVFDFGLGASKNLDVRVYLRYVSAGVKSAD
jgi:hypothetical protein